MGFVIRKFKRGDEKEVAKLIYETFRKYNENDGSKKAIKKYLENNSLKKSSEELFNQYNGEIAFVALDGKKIIGFVKGKRGHLRNLFVYGKYHGKGIGKMLMKKFESESKRMGSKEVVISHASTYAVPFYEKIGYKKTTGVRTKCGLKVQPMKKV